MDSESKEGEARRQRAARLAGFLYLFTNATAVFAFYARGRVIATGDAVQTAKNIAASERLFRLGVVGELVTVAGVVALVVALYAVLRAVDRHVALLAASWRLLECVVLAIVPLNVFTTLALLGGAEYLRAVDAAELQALAYVFLRVHGAGFRIAFFFLGLGSAAFAYLWLRSRFVPRVLAALGIFASLLMTAAEVAVLMFPALARVVGMAYMAPMGLFEIALGGWLLVKGVRAGRAASA